MSIFEFFVERFILFFKIFDLAVERLLLLDDSAFLTLNFRAAFPQLAFQLIALFVNFVLCLNDGFLFFGFRLGKGVVNDPGRLLRGRADFCFCNALATTAIIIFRMSIMK